VHGFDALKDFPWPELWRRLQNEAGRPEEAMKVTARRVIRWRARSRLSQHDFWARVGVTQSSGSRYEAGQAALPRSVQRLLVIAYGRSLQKHRELVRLKTR
jgi:DNA-binding transcriptional regulator YiaG